MFGIRSWLLKWALRPAACFLLTFSTTYASGWVSTMPADRPDQDLCQALLDRLNHTDNACILFAVEEYPGFTSPPWQTLDASEHIELIAKLLGYRGGPDTMTDRQWSAKLQGAKEFISGGGTLKVWQTRLLTFFDSDAQFPVPPGEQTVVRMSKKYGLLNCPTRSSYFENENFVVLPDLSGPDVRVKVGTAYGLATNEPVLYKGRTLFIDNEVVYIGAGELANTSYVRVYQLVKETGVHGSVCLFGYKGNNQSSAGK